MENKFAEDRRKIKRFPLASKLRTIASGNQAAFLCELLLVHSVLLLGTFATYVSTSCCLVLLLLLFVRAVTWHFSYFPTGVAVEIRYQRTSPDSAKVHWARQELGAEEKKPMRVFSGSRQFIFLGKV